jgi:serine/threonine protein kinase
MVVGFCAGGELRFHLKNIGRFTENQAKFYFAEALLALEYLHSKNIIYNNLRPENIMLDIDGHIKLVDFSRSYSDASETWAFYTLGQKVTSTNDLVVAKACDCYSLGALLYEMLTQQKVDHESDRCPTKDESFFPRFLSKEVKSLLAGLLAKDPHSRLGTDKIKEHAWCKDINWARLLKKRIVPPFKPNLKSSNFDPEILSIPVRIESAEGDYLRGFDYSSESVEKCFANMNEMLSSASNAPSERNSTVAEESLLGEAGRSMDLSNERNSSYESTQSFTIQTQTDLRDYSFGIKSLSPVVREKRMSSVRALFRNVTGKFFKEDYRRQKELEELTRQITTKTKDGSKMQECIRRKIRKER